MSIRKQLADLLIAAALRLQEQGVLPAGPLPVFQVEVPKISEHGDFASNLALVLAKTARQAPRRVAELLREHLAAPPRMLTRVEIAGPGFLNFFLTPFWWRQVLLDIEAAGDRYGHSDLGAGRKVQVEFVSANPTGPLHVGHGRGAALGDALANILAATGHQVVREYYINDVGLQIRNLGRSLYFRARQLQGETVSLPEDCYQGDYVIDLARQYLQNHGPLPPGEPSLQDLETYGRFAGEAILTGIRQDLADFGVHFDQWFSEAGLLAAGALERALAVLRDRGYLYEADGALWFKATAFGDEKDRVVRRQTGATTYFASDIAYHWDKFARGFDQVIDIWGADHHGYVPRLKAVIQALGLAPERLQIILVQLVSLVREGQPVAMTTRGGTFVTLREVMDEVGRDAARFIFLSRRADAHLEFDLELAKKQAPENPVYYVQYAHARLASVFRLAAEKGLNWHAAPAAGLERLELPEEMTLLKTLAAYPDTVEAAALHLEPHRITYYLTDLAGQLHSYYYKHRFISEDLELSLARLKLVQGIKAVLAHGLQLLGVTAPETM